MIVFFVCSETKLTELHHDRTTDSDTIATNLMLERDSLREQSQLFQNTIDAWSQRYEIMRAENEQLVM